MTAQSETPGSVGALPGAKREAQRKSFSESHAVARSRGVKACVVTGEDRAEADAAARAGVMRGSAARTPPGGASGLPCLNSNNCTKPLPPGARRTAFALAENVRLLAERFGLERLGFLTLTFRDHVTDIREAQRRFHSLRTHVLAERYPASIAVVERMKSKRIHFHLLVVCPHDIRTGFDFAAVAAGDYSSANEWLRKEWAFWRRTAPSFGFGRTELLPIKSTAEGIAKYVGKYIAKHLDARIPEDKGARLVRYTLSARQVTANFAWVSPLAKEWRTKTGELAAAVGAEDTEELAAKLGTKRWAYYMRRDFLESTPQEWAEFCAILAQERGGTFTPRVVEFRVGGVVVATITQPHPFQSVSEEQIHLCTNTPINPAPLISSSNDATKPLETHSSPPVLTQALPHVSSCGLPSDLERSRARCCSSESANPNPSTPPPTKPLLPPACADWRNSNEARGKIDYFDVK